MVRFHTGIFTAPESGMYQFIFAIDTFGVNEAEARLVVNGVYIMDAIAEGRVSGHNDQGCNAANVRLRRGQNVWLEHYYNGGN